MTLIRTKSGEIMPVNGKDWAWWNIIVPQKLRTLTRQGYRVMIFTNQNNILLQQQRLSNFQSKLEELATELNVPLVVYIAPVMNHYRKPEIGMWELMLLEQGISVAEIADAFYVGDAAGREDDWSDSDRVFALNVGRFWNFICFPFSFTFSLSQFVTAIACTFDYQPWLDISKTDMTPLFVYINGYPGVGKLTVAKELCKLLPKAKILDNHLLIDPAAAVFERTAEEYQPLRQVLRREILKSLATATTTRETSWIFTDQQSSSALGSASAKDYQQAAAVRGAPFISVVLNCDLDENLQRAVGGDRGAGSNTKLTDPAILRHIRQSEDIFRFKDQNELVLDVTHLPASEAARKIHEHIRSVQTTHATECMQLQPTKTFADLQGFKQEFVADIKRGLPDRTVRLLCWLLSRPRDHGGLVFLSVGDSTGTIQVVANSAALDKGSELGTLKPESSLMVHGRLTPDREGTMEISADKIYIISKATGTIHPNIRRASPKLLEAQSMNHLLTNRHLYLRNPLIMALNVYRSQLLTAVHEWFKKHQFIDVSAPLLTRSILYEPKSAIQITGSKNDKPVFLSQCAGFYLEAAAHAHERVYNLGPSFRSESRTNRHLMEYWHIKAELCSGSMDDIIQLVEIFLHDIFHSALQSTQDVTRLLGTEYPTIQIPFMRITYREALALLKTKGLDLAFGDNICRKAEILLTSHFGGPVWLTHKPRSLEPFPYSLCPDDPELTMTADLISSAGFGEICGVAEKSFTREDLETRLEEKGKSAAHEMYGWVLQSRDFGMAPHTAFGMGFERVLRWFCGAPHVKDMIPFPRVFGRDPTP
ncbi:uncharacterized protein DSM5745_07211 [Aspergillus mulundensis]|uniref:Aminoacyl-transfer RNA synthetases class-II family profile domain-containing protein n=1 Tax=Aspergillus mulundensis TaxID=1810919 RepID=A0A3D8RKG8_9EURO|nr:hypothetical protein DSM5745_07211 [Aspergillus mulundensis]RDW74549.1 hypothetical protein DSM5745_07211 [Aspergillus mulundensis]